MEWARLLRQLLLNSNFLLELALSSDSFLLIVSCVDVYWHCHFIFLASVVAPLVDFSVANVEAAGEAGNLSSVPSRILRVLHLKLSALACVETRALYPFEKSFFDGCRSIRVVVR